MTFIAINAYIKKQKHLMKLEEQQTKPQITRKWEITKTKVEIETKNTTAKINETKRWVFLKDKQNRQAFS